MSCIFKPDMHHTWLCIMPCLCGGCLLCCLLLPMLLLRVSSDKAAFVRIRSTTSVYLLHEIVLLPYGISGKMTIPSKSLLSLLASCSLYRYLALPTTCYIMPPILPCQASNLPFLANRCLAKLPLLLSLSHSVASCRWSWSWFHVGTWNFWIITISLI